MKTRLFSALDHALERRLPEQRLFLKSEEGTRFIRLRPTMQAGIVLGGAAIACWTFVVTAIFLMDTISSGNAREQAQRERAIYEARLNALSNERDDRAVEASAAHERFYVALEQISEMQSSLLASEDRRNELETGIEVIQTTLRKTMKDRDAARDESEVLLAQINADGNSDAPLLARAKSTDGSVSFLTEALEQTAAERDQIARDAQDAIDTAAELRFTLKMNEDRNEQIFSRLEEAVTVSLEPLDKMFRAAGMPTESILREVRRGYSGQGGPLLPATMSTSGGGTITDKTSTRANRLLKELDRINLFRIAADKSPVAMPVKAAFRFTSPFGYRKDPKGAGRRMHAGVDFAGSRGTPIYATADGVVTHAGWQSGYGRLVKIKHAFGIETRYAHNSNIRVKVGQRVSRGDRISDMGATGRVTGTHLHYEVRLNGTPVNPMTYIKAGRDVF
ncbi:murein DD-endopeptidase MepM/ murein hydrolase activator NlpD [Litoreibacter halocynthiae]|uniref:Murein DD-endopeptidase MepM/ murein hydrolase activator NlpD n=1 Tax=Litoreibacter halocynthiae TaxID=1242689 RepID=A0A4R7LNI3_9RHOB|nr:M23 family metallopeptidase [Litoreibacter halocynthiae]TDT77598.1 murein DD-endopeptidase MepM/ murein hydrolase activator NlpD [Litoreibacter halocynthiae]